jgi:hypothetical protein
MAFMAFPTTSTTRRLTSRGGLKVPLEWAAPAYRRGNSALTNIRRRRPLLPPAPPGCRNRWNGRQGACSVRVRFLQSPAPRRSANVLAMSSLRYREVDHVVSSRLIAAGRATRAHIRVSWRSHARPVFSCAAHIHLLEDAGPALGTSSVLADYVGGMADWDIARPDQAQALTVKIIPGTAPVLLIHYRTPFTSTWQFGSRGRSRRWGRRL